MVHPPISLHHQLGLLCLVNLMKLEHPKTMDLLTIQFLGLIVGVVIM